MLGWNEEDGWWYSPIMIALVAIVLAFQFIRRFVRRKSLRQRDDGMFVWLEWTGREKMAETDPREPGGAWNSDGDGGDGGD